MSFGAPPPPITNFAHVYCCPTTEIWWTGVGWGRSSYQSVIRWNCDYCRRANAYILTDKSCGSITCEGCGAPATIISE